MANMFLSRQNLSAGNLGRKDEKRTKANCTYLPLMRRKKPSTSDVAGPELTSLPSRSNVQSTSGLEEKASDAKWQFQLPNRLTSHIAAFRFPDHPVHLFLRHGINDHVQFDLSWEETTPRAPYHQLACPALPTRPSNRLRSTERQSAYCGEIWST